AQDGNGYSGSPPPSTHRSHDTPPATPPATSLAQPAEPASRRVATPTVPAVKTSGSVGPCHGYGPKRAISGRSSGGKSAAQPCVYAAPPLAGATISWCSQTPVPVSGSVSVEYHTSRRPGWPRQRGRIKACAGWNAGTKAPDDADDSDDANG